MDDIFVKSDIECTYKDLILLLRRFGLLLNYIDINRANLIERIQLCDLLNEMACNVKIQTENLTNYLVIQNSDK